MSIINYRRQQSIEGLAASGIFRELFFVKVVLGAGHSISSNIPQAAKYVKDIDIDLLIDAIENELDGQIVDVRSGEKDTITVVIE
ncbi:hypothetical protein SAMN02799616_04076 [Paenibacillus sp. UNC499MF]|nr:hypothetical protein SAMN02799616_04076 [Paenibacillus sp. UNC499MF]